MGFGNFSEIEKRKRLREAPASELYQQVVSEIGEQNVLRLLICGFGRKQTDEALTRITGQPVNDLMTRNCGYDARYEPTMVAETADGAAVGQIEDTNRVTLTGEERKARIADIRARKGHLLGLNHPFPIGGHDGYVPAKLPGPDHDVPPPRVEP